MRFAWLLVLPLLTVACTVTPPLPIVDALPPLREAFLGETLSVQGQLEGGSVPSDADIGIAGQVVGRVSKAGAFEVNIGEPNGFVGSPDIAFTFTPSAPSGVTRLACELETLSVSDRAARILLVKELALRARGGVSPQTTPIPPPPALTRFPVGPVASGVVFGWLVYADRDVTVQGRRACTYREMVGGRFFGTAVSVNVRLRRGWNDVRVAQRGTEGTTWYSVSGGDGPAASGWRYNGGPLRADF